MKNKLVITCLLIASIMAVAGCSKKEEEPTVDPAQDVEDAAEEEEEAVPGKMLVVSPLPATIDMNQLTDCTVSVSLDSGHAYVNEEGVQKMRVTVFTHDLYDMVDISQLKSGDMINISQESVMIASLERTDNGVIINGGLEAGGHELRTDDNTTYYEISYSDLLAYYNLGEITLPVSPDFVYTDSSDLDNGPVTYTFNDLAEEKVDYFFTPHNTKIVIEGGSVVAMERTYMP